MDLVVVLLLRRSGGKYLLVEDQNTKLLKLPSKGLDVSKDHDTASVVQSLMEDDLNVSGKPKGILKLTQYTAVPPVLTIVVVADEVKPRYDQATPIQFFWLSGPEIQRENIIVDQYSLGLVSQLENNAPVHSMELLETVEGNGLRRIHGILEKQMLEEAGYGQYELDQIAEEFVRICGSPSGMINAQEFGDLVELFGWPPDKTVDCFRSLRSSIEGGLTLEELQVGLCALDPATPHGSVSGQLRCQFIFRFYNVSGKGFMSFQEFREMVRDIFIFKNQLNEKTFEKSLIDNWKVFGVTESHGLSMSKFLTIVGQLKFRGTSVLFRLPQSPVKHQTDPYNIPERPNCPSPCPSPFNVKLRPIRPKEPQTDDEHMEVSLNDTISGSDKPATGPMSATDSNDLGFTIATHSVKVKRSGALSDVTTIWDLVGTEAVSGTVRDLLDPHKPSFDRLPSIKAFDKASKSNEMLSGLRYFEHALRDDGRGRAKAGFSWGAIDMGSVARCFLTICSQAVDIFANENRLLPVKSPCYVLGDLHGNFHDLICFEKVLWRMGPILTPASFMFLGDYVDRGDFGFEVISYLFAQKLLMPSKFLLIRGNHEIRSVQESFTYKTECYHKFGESLGEEVWEATNTVFDAMPVAAVIDEKVFCVHGGIPHPSHGGGYISAINDIPNHLPEPAEGSPLAWDIMWNDPIRKEDEDNDDSLRTELVGNEGFIDNDSRGTGHMFSSDALDSFLRRNNLSHVIRAHEVKETGFQLQQNGRLLTVFSSSHYCGSTNEAACVLVDNKKIRTIRLDTRS
ncbi:PREDICTED: uncharacterized protein LOC100639057 isoform X2 [Amphimedon queenslandica]|uniref:Serine/threonine-protein phosphatase n=1 Tax=Amphimedon queenslandica TaxID=400682 RepID=A0AAN0IAT4_AMPQE|nr:PREDICTED: uncharacterized protein LOC100639057 isoform X2 [Amphimedon queenslandica]|eukprot:XP_003384155.1 PREDICTED: uncharacterized protein LOC100639057 isoform X2 [Amphimedon queenslandica]